MGDAMDAPSDIRISISRRSSLVGNDATPSPSYELTPRTNYVRKPILVSAYQADTDEGGNTFLHNAARAANLAQVRNLLPLASHVSLRVSNYAGCKPLHYIVKHRGKAWHQVLVIILKKGGFTSSANLDGDTPLHIAARAQNMRAVEALVNHELKMGASSGHLPSNRANQTALDVAVRATLDATMSDKILTLVKGSHFLNDLLNAVLVTYGTSNRCKENTEDDKECPQALLLWLLTLQRNSAVCSEEYLMTLWRLDEQGKLKICKELMKGSSWLYYALLWLAPRTDFDVQYVYADGQTILHIALAADCEEIVKLIFKRQDLVEADAEDEKGITPVQQAVEKGLREIEILLMKRPEVKESVERLYRDRQVYVDAANAILVGSALIASVTFAGWLQPPLGYGNGKDNARMYVAIEGHPSVSSFCVFNSLSFLFAMATVVAGAGTVLPRPDLYIGTAVHMLKTYLSVAASLLLLAALFGIAAFCSAGFAVLPPTLKWDLPMILTVLLGGSVNAFMMGWFLKGLLCLRPGYCKRMKDEAVKRRSKAKARRIVPQW